MLESLCPGNFGGHLSKRPIPVYSFHREDISGVSAGFIGSVTSHTQRYGTFFTMRLPDPVGER